MFYEDMIRAAIRNAAAGAFLTLAFCGVAIFYFEQGRWWFVAINVVLAAFCSLPLVQNIRTYWILQRMKGARALCPKDGEERASPQNPPLRVGPKRWPFITT